MRLPTLPTWLWIALATLLIVALNTTTIALCGPWDPWETHYGEVARQILVRDDPLDLWWRPGYGPDGNAENTFWSKPALPFWLMALSMAIFGVGTRPAADELVRSPLPELALRLPSLLAGLLCAAFLGYVVWRLLRDDSAAASRGPSSAARAGIFTAVVLSTMPQWALVGRQALTDMFFVAPVVVAMGAWALAWLQPDRELRARRAALQLGVEIAQQPHLAVTEHRDALAGLDAERLGRPAFERLVDHDAAVRLAHAQAEEGLLPTRRNRRDRRRLHRRSWWLALLRRHGGRQHHTRRRHGFGTFRQLHHDDRLLAGAADLEAQLLTRLVAADRRDQVVPGRCRPVADREQLVAHLHACAGRR